jgi:hypothetical protein
VTRSVPFTQASVERAIKAVRKMGLRVTGVSVNPDGAFIHAVEDDGRAPHSSLTSGPRLRDAREKFRAG